MSSTAEKKQSALVILRKLDIAEQDELVGKEFSQDIADKILLLLRQGVFFRDASYALGLDQETMISWMSDNPKFAKQVHKFRYQAITEIQKKLWRIARDGDLKAIELFLKAIDPIVWNIRPKDIKDDGEQVEKVIFVDTILETKMID